MTLSLGTGIIELDGLLLFGSGVLRPMSPPGVKARCIKVVGNPYSSSDSEAARLGDRVPLVNDTGAGTREGVTGRDRGAVPYHPALGVLAPALLPDLAGV